MYFGMDELKASEKFVGTVMVQTGFHDDEADRFRVLTADAPSLASAIGFQDRVAKAAQNQGSRYESGCLIFDKQNSLHGTLRPTDRRRGYRLWQPTGFTPALAWWMWSTHAVENSVFNVWKVAS